MHSSPNSLASRSPVVLSCALKFALVAVASAAVGGAAQAQTAAAQVLISVTGDHSFVQEFPGVGSNLLRAASHTFGAALNDYTVEGTATAGRGTVSTFATSFTSVANGLNDSTFVSATGSSGDSFTIHFDEPVAAPATLTFTTGATGEATYSPPALNSFATGYARITYGYTISASNGQSFSHTGRREKGVTFAVQNGQLVYFPYEMDTGTWGGIVNDIVVAPGATEVTITISMSSEARASAKTQSTSGSVQAIADFGSTLRWAGLSSIAYSDGTPFKGGFTVSSPSGYNYVKPADIDFDGEVGSSDLSQLLSDWGTTATESDISQNGVVDAADLARLLQAWGT